VKFDPPVLPQGDGTIDHVIGFVVVPTTPTDGYGVVFAEQENTSVSVGCGNNQIEVRQFEIVHGILHGSGFTHLVAISL